MEERTRKQRKKVKEIPEDKEKSKGNTRRQRGKYRKDQKMLVHCKELLLKFDSEVLPV